MNRHGDGDALDGLAGLVQHSAGEGGHQVRVADGGGQRGVLDQVQVLVGQWRDDHPQRLRQDDQPPSVRLELSPRRTASVWPWLTAWMPARTISAMKAAV